MTMHKFFFGLLKEWSRVSYERDNPGVNPFDKVSDMDFCLE